MTHPEDPRDFIEPIKGLRMNRRDFTTWLGSAALLAGPGAVLLAACGEDDAPAPTTTAAPATTAAPTTTAAAETAALVTREGEPVLGLVSTLAIEFYNEWNKGAGQAAEALGLEWQLQVDEFDVQTAESIIDSAVGAGTRMFVTSSLSTANEPVIASATGAAGAYLINNYNIPDFYTPFDSGALHIAWLVPDEILAAEQLASIVIEAAGGRGNFVHITGHPTTPVDWRRTLGVDNALAKYPEANLVTRQNADWDRAKGQQVMANALVQTGNDVAGVFGQNDDMIIGAIAALAEAGVEAATFGMDGVQEAQDLIRDGSLTTTSIVFPIWIGGYNVVQIFDAVNGFVRTDPERMMYWNSPPLTIEGGAPAYPLSDVQAPDYDWELMSRVLSPEDWDPQNELYPMNPDEIWATRDAPAGWVNPLQPSIDNGEFERVRQMYADHYQRKII